MVLSRRQLPAYKTNSKHYVVTSPSLLQIRNKQGMARAVTKHRTCAISC